MLLVIDAPKWCLRLLDDSPGGVTLLLGVAPGGVMLLNAHATIYAHETEEDIPNSGVRMLLSKLLRSDA